MIGKIDVWADCGYCQALDNVEHSVKTRREICSQRLSELCRGPTQFPVSEREAVCGGSHHQVLQSVLPTPSPPDFFSLSSGSGRVDPALNTTDRISH